MEGETSDRRRCKRKEDENFGRKFVMRMKRTCTRKEKNVRKEKNKRDGTVDNMK